MANDLEPIQLRNRLRDTLQRYLATAVPISATRAPALAHAVRDKIAEEDSLVRGPFVESLPDYQKGASLDQLVETQVLVEEWHSLDRTGFKDLLRRPFHTHQETAMRRAADRQNFIVATGTGSGKTECFLYPIVDRLLRGGDLDTPGVRAILVYPLNALANDQLYFRIAPLLLRQLGDPGITFGRFTGHVRSSATRAEEHDRLSDNEALMQVLGLEIDDELPESWRLSRSEMLERPPHILITNYAMLEHLLLLPRNASLFHGAQLQFLVLDEIHAYSGAQAIEVAFLIRKLKTRLDLNPGTIQAIGTSASLDTNRGQDLAQFACDIFGEPFGAPGESVITGRRQLHELLRSTTPNRSVDARTWEAVGQVAVALREHDAPSVRVWNEHCRTHALTSFLLREGARLGSDLTRLLARFEEVHRVAAELKGGLREFGNLARCVFPDAAGEERNRALHGLIETAIFARPDDQSFPILPARYHLAASGIQGGVVRLDAAAAEGWSDLQLKRSHDAPNGVPYFRVLACRNCGEPYLEGWKSGDTVLGKPSAGASRCVFRIKALASSGAIEIGTDDDDEGPENNTAVRWVDPQTGRIAAQQCDGAVATVECALNEDPDEKQ